MKSITFVNQSNDAFRQRMSCMALDEQMGHAGWADRCRERKMVGADDAYVRGRGVALIDPPLFGDADFAAPTSGGIDAAIRLGKAA